MIYSMVMKRERNTDVHFSSNLYDGIVSIVSFIYTLNMFNSFAVLLASRNFGLD